MGILVDTYGAAVSAIKGLIGKANGIAGLGADGKVPAAQLPTSGGGTVQDATTLAIKATDEGSPAGNTRGDNAVDLQTERSNAADAATGDNSTISGGQSNEAGGAHSTVSGGFGNQANNSYSSVGGGSFNAASGNTSTIAGGASNTASGSLSTVSGGTQNQATAYGATVSGGLYGAATRCCERAFAAFRFAATGDAQVSGFMFGAATTDATQATMQLAYGSSPAQYLALANTEYLSGRLTVFARRSNGDFAKWTFEDVTADRIGSGNVTVTVGAVGEASGIGPDIYRGTGSTLVVDVNADTSNQALRVQVTGNASENWRWHAIFDAHRGLYGS